MRAYGAVRKKGLPSHWVTHVVLSALPLALIYAWLFAGGPVSWPGFWFGTVLALGIAYLGSAYLGEDSVHHACAMTAAGLLIGGVIALTGQPWLRAAYIPYIFASGTFAGPPGVAAGLIASVLLEAARAYLSGPIGGLYGEAGFMGIMAISAGLGYFAWLRAGGLRANPGATSGTDFIDEADEGVRQILRTVSLTLRPGGVALFMGPANGLAPRSSSHGRVELLSSGLIQEAAAAGKPLVLRENNLRGLSAGYKRQTAIRSVLAAPIMDGSITLGILAVDSPAPNAFGSKDDLGALALFAGQVARHLQGQRVSAEMARAHEGLKVLQEESARLVSSLNMEVIVGNTIEGLKRIAPLSAVFFLKEPSGLFMVAGTEGLGELPEVEGLSLDETLAGMVFDGGEQVYVSSLKGYSLPLLPFKVQGAASALMLPLLSGGKPFGVAVLYFEEPGALSPHQVELLQVLANQAAVSLKNAMLHDEIRQSAITDGLTGLFNHKNFQEKLDLELKRFDRFGLSFSVLLLDIDFFKSVNDTYGHPAGDAVLAGIAGMLRDSLRSFDVTARYGGEEFAAILIDTSPEDAEGLATRLGDEIGRTAFDVDGTEIKVTVSVGISSCPGDSRERAALVEMADKALYHAKRTGRDRVVSYSDPEVGEALPD